MGIAEICGLVIWIGLWDPAYVKHNYNNMSQLIINKLPQMGWSSKAPSDTTFWKKSLQSSKGYDSFKLIVKKIFIGSSVNSNIIGPKC